MRARRWALLAALPLAFGTEACASSGGPALATLAGRIDGVLDAPPLDGVHFGVLVLDAASGDTLYRRNAHRRFVPASNQKLLTTATALIALGPEYRFDTSLWTTAPEVDARGVLDGDLVLPGHGDPTLSARFWRGDDTALDALSDSVVAAGVRTVTGRLIVDLSMWDSTSVRGTWMTGDLDEPYAATGGAFSIEEGTTTAILEGTRVGEPVRARWHPAGDPGFVRSEVVTAPAGDSARVRVRYLPEARRAHLTGQVQAGTTDTVRFATRDPAGQASRALLAALETHGISVAGGLEIVWEPGRAWAADCSSGTIEDCPSARRLGGLVSPALMDIAQGILEPSQNWMAEQLFRHVGEVATGRGSWRAGAEAMRAVLLDSLAVDSLDLHVRDGSGLSAYNLVTPRALASVLRAVRRRPWAARYRSALPSPGEEDSTLERRLEGLEAQVAAKTGTITHVNSLSGFLTTLDGRELIFVLMSNGSGRPSSEVRAALDRVVEILSGTALVR